MARPTFPAHRETHRERFERRGAIDDPEVVLNAEARFLEVRPRSVAEVRRHLTGKGYRADLVEPAVARLTELGMLDDAAFARAWIESRYRVRPRAARVMRQELALKGVERALIDAAIVEHEQRQAESRSEAAVDQGTADERAAQRLLARRRAALARIADPRTRAQRAYALLARNGFEPDVCRAASARFLDDAADT
jgi:regulatory protein